MKKLIIAAAMAVVAGGAFALDGYDFTATLKTTKGKSGKATATINLGADATGAKFWYEDTTLATWFANVDYVTTKNVGGTTVPTLKAAKVKEDAALQKAIKAIASIYSHKSNGKWCETYKFTDEGCYRVAGSTKIAEEIFTTNCCAVSATIEITNIFDTVTGVVTGGVYVRTFGGMYSGFVNRFGSLEYAKATKVEMYADVENVPTTDERLFWYGTLAGQGTYAKGRVDSVSGNIVGAVLPTLCPTCCTLPVTAVAFKCDDPVTTLGFIFDPTGEKQAAYEASQQQGSSPQELPKLYNSLAEVQALPTAAFGTFRLKYNAKISD